MSTTAELTWDDFFTSHMSDEALASELLAEAEDAKPAQ